MSLVPLNLPQYPFRIRNNGQSKEIFDALRGKYVTLTPEEWVRQHFIAFLKEALQYPAGRMTVEKGHSLNKRAKRTDIVVYSPSGKPWMIVECKAPHVPLSGDPFYQAAGYHHKLEADYLVVTNGIQHFCCKFDAGKFEFQNEFPVYEK